MATDWRTDWETFVETVAGLYRQGLSDQLVTEYFAGKPVTWAGRLVEKEFADDLPGVQMKMPPVDVRLPLGRSAVVDYIFLTLNSGEMRLWDGVLVGMQVRFATQIRRASGPFLGIKCAELDEHRAAILFLTEGAKPVRH